MYTRYLIFFLKSHFPVSLSLCPAVCLTHKTNSAARETALANGFLMGCWVSCVSELMATTYPKHTNTLTSGIQTESFPLCLVSLKWLRNLTPLTTSCSSADWSHIWTLIPLRTHKTLCKERDTRQMLSNFITRHYSTHSHRWKWENALHCYNRVTNTKFRTELPVNPGARAKLHYLIHETIKRKIKRWEKVHFRGKLYQEMTIMSLEKHTTYKVYFALFHTMEVYSDLCCQTLKKAP